MPSNVHYALTVRNATTDQLVASAALNGGTIEIRDGVQPATPETAATGNLLAVLTLNAAAFGASAAGIATAGAITAGVGLVAGTATWARIKTAGGVAKIDCSAGGAGNDLVLAAPVIAVGATVSCSSLTVGTGA